MIILYILIFVILILLLVSKLILNLAFGNRCEGNAKLKYFTADDFEGLQIKPVEFKSNKGQLLRGYIYTNKDIKEYKGLIIFVHGMGGGHLSYTTEINTFAKAGFSVMAYDNTGTCSSEGKSLKGFFQSVIDLKYALKFVEGNEYLNKYPIGLVGHSWGAYTVCQVLQFNPNIKAVVAISGPNDSAKLICDFMKNEAKMNFSFLKPFITIVNFLTFGIKGVKNTINVLKETKIPVLLLHGELDKTAPLENSPISNKGIESNNNIKTIVYEGRFHNVYQTKESEEYLNKTFGDISELTKKYKGNLPENEINKIYDNIDYKKITEEDEEVMNTIIKFLEESIEGKNSEK